MKTQPELKAIRGGDFCEGIVMVKKAGYRVRCHGAVARELSACRTGSPLLVVGRLSTHAWETGNRQQHERIVVIAEQITPLTPPRAEDVL